MERLTDSMHARYIEDFIIETNPVHGWEGPETIKNAGENMAALAELIGTRKVGLLCHMPDTYIDGSARSYYKNHDQIAVAAALVAKSMIQTTIGNFFIKFGLISTPIRMFTNDAAAKDWLQKKLTEANASIGV